MRCLPAVLLATALPSQEPVAMFEADHVQVEGVAFGYRLLAPAEVDENRRYPLVVFLHGAGERGDDNERQLLLMPAGMAEPERRERFPCFVLALQCPEDMQWVDVPWDEVQSRQMLAEPSLPLRAVIAAMQRTWETHPVDRDRVYLTGLSMGGYGAFDLAMRHPEWFAGMVVVCGGGDERTAHRIADLPLQVWHGADDPVVPVDRSRNMVAALRELGSAVDYRELPGVQHASWIAAYGQEGALPWLFAQDRRAAGRSQARPAPLVPWPRDLASSTGEHVLGANPRIASPAVLREHAEVLAGELAALTGAAAEVSGGSEGDVVLALDETLGEEEYVFEVTTEVVRVAGRDLEAVSRGTSTLLQAVENAAGRWRLPAFAIRDRPAFGYRAVMVDCARHFQSVEVLRQVVDMCRLYKVRYLQLHLTDDQAFTFPSAAFPDAVTPGRSYSRQDLTELDSYAAARGIGIVPELDVPGHSSALIRAYPEVFGLGDRRRNAGLVNVGREAAYAGIDRLLGELCEVFDSSPWVHVGGDEAWLEGLAEDPEAVEYMRRHDLAGPHDLYRHFLGRVHAMVSRHGRRTLLWEGFRRGGRIEVPKDVIVVAWDGAYYRPDHLVEDGYEVINASWQPLYIVGGGRVAPHAAPRMWTQEHVHSWHARRWEHFEPKSPAFAGLDVAADAPVLGGQMCVWEQREHTTVQHLRPRLPAFAERLWNPSAPGFANFRGRWPAADARFLALAQPVTILPRPVEGRVAHGFRERARVSIVARRKGTVRYTTNGELPTSDSPRYDAPFEVSADALVRARLFGPDGGPLGGSDWSALRAEPQHVVRYALYEAPREGWARVPDFDLLEPFARGTWPEIRGGERAGAMGVVQETILNVPEAGDYRFRLESCDGPARLLLDGEVAVLHAHVGQWEGTVGIRRLAAGDVRLRIEAAQGVVNTLLRLTWQPPGADTWQRLRPHLRLP